VAISMPRKIAMKISFLFFPSSAQDPETNAKLERKECKSVLDEICRSKHPLKRGLCFAQANGKFSSLGALLCIVGRKLWIWNEGPKFAVRPWNPARI
jgi:hypothetical protein